MSFTDTERALLLSIPRIGPSVVSRLEEVGIDSLASLRQTGLDCTIDSICSRIGSLGWANRRDPLSLALRAHMHQGNVVTSDRPSRRLGSIQRRCCPPRTA